MENIEVPNKTGHWRIYRKGARDAIQMFLPYIPKKPKVLVGKKMGEKQARDMMIATIAEQCIRDPAFLECYLMGDEMIMFWKDGEKYQELEVVPRRFTKKIIVRTDEPQY